MNARIECLLRQMVLMGVGVLSISVLVGCGSSTSYQSFITDPAQLQRVFRECLAKKPGSEQDPALCQLIREVKNPDYLRKAILNQQKFGKEILAIQSRLVVEKKCLEQKDGLACAKTDDERKAAVVASQQELNQHFSALKLIRLLVGQ